MPPQQQNGELLQAYGHPTTAFFHLFWKVYLKRQKACQQDLQLVLKNKQSVRAGCSCPGLHILWLLQFKFHCQLRCHRAPAHP